MNHEILALFDPGSTMRNLEIKLVVGSTVIVPLSPKYHRFYVQLLDIDTKTTIRPRHGKYAEM